MTVCLPEINTHDIDTRPVLDLIKSSLANVVEKPLANALHYHFDSPASYNRAKITLTAGSMLGLPSKDNVVLASVVELLHNASLIHDDIQDKDRERRGQPSLWYTYDANTAISAGDLLISTAYSLIAKISKIETIPQILLATNRCVRETINGQTLDLSFNDSQSFSESKYEKVAKLKAAPLLTLAIELPLLYNDYENPEPVVRSATEPFAIAYQMADDLADHIEDEFNDSLNIINLKKQDTDSMTALKSVQQRILSLLNSSVRNCQILPSNCGSFLIDAAEKLAQKAGSISYA